MRRTIARAKDFRGTGLHGGRPARLRIEPATAPTGIRFRRTDLGTDWLEALHDRVTDTRLCTRLSAPGQGDVSTVEHLMAALAGLGITDADILIDGPEVPIMDGSSAPFVSGILAAGTRRFAAPLEAIRITREIRVEDGGRVAALLPADRLEIDFEIEFPDPAIGRQAVSLGVSGDAFVSELAECRTFCRLDEVEHLRSLGLAKGGGLENAIVVDGGRVLNPGGLRRVDEFVRHKALDAVGDLALAGRPILGRYVGRRAGHEMTNRLLHALFAAPDAWETVEAEDDALPRPGRRRARPAPVAAEAMAI